MALLAYNLVFLFILAQFFSGCTRPPQYRKNLMDVIHDDSTKERKQKVVKKEGRVSKEKFSKLLYHGQVRVLLYKGKKLPRLIFEKKYLVFNRMDDLILRGPRGALKVPKAGFPLFSQVFSGGLVRLNGKSYKGHFYLVRKKNNWLFINETDLPKYLRGVLPSEMNPSWPLEALKAQAIAARTYGLYHVLKNNGMPYHVHSTTASQVYSGTGGVNTNIDKAVTETRGIVLTYKGKVFPAFFHSTSGGITEKGDALWGKKKFGFTKIVKTEYGKNSPYYTWKTMMPVERFLNFLKRKFDMDSIKSFHIVKRSDSGRVKSIRLIGKKNGENTSQEIDGNKFRLAFGAGKLKSLLFELGESSDGQKQNIVFEGRGYGHGVGMCQWGANDMARQGKSAREILEYYYNNIQLEKIAHKNYIIARKQ